MQVYKEFIYYWLFDLSGRESFSKEITTLLVGLTIVLVAFICFLACRKILIAIVRRVAKKTVTEWDDILIKHKFFHGISHFIPASIFYFEASFANSYYPMLEGYILKASNIYFLIAFIVIINSFLNALNEIYNTSFSSAKERPISGVVQFVKIFMYFICVLIFISIIFNKNLVTLLTGLGAMAAILVLVFKDTILGFVASIQITMNDMIKIGDWIEMPSKLANGTITEINLTTVKVQNGDKTITNIPIYSLISDSFINWKGMEQSGVRRIKRSVNLDMNSVKICDEMMLERFRNFDLIKNYIEELQNEAIKNESKPEKNRDNFLSWKNQTNLGIFRMYLENFLHNYPLIDNNMTIVVRHLQPTENGIPIEINVFSKETEWVKYEAIQSDIFDYILAVIPEFELKVFQHPSGSDFKALIIKTELPYQPV
jgi:miniconductance mechanosensitive channel